MLATKETLATSDLRGTSRKSTSSRNARNSVAVSNRRDTSYRRQTYEEHHGQALAAWMLTTAGVLATEGRQQQQTYSKEYQGSTNSTRQFSTKEREKAGRFRLFLNNFYGFKNPITCSALVKTQIQQQLRLS